MPAQKSKIPKKKKLLKKNNLLKAADLSELLAPEAFVSPPATQTEISQNASPNFVLNQSQETTESPQPDKLVISSEPVVAPLPDIEEPEAELSQLPAQKQINFSSVLAYAVIALVLLGAGTFAFREELAKLSWFAKPGNQQTQAETSQVSDPTQGYLASLKKIMLLPESEQPFTAVVSDAEKLKFQPFFAQAQNGDFLVIYQAAKKAILFRPQENKIIESSPYINDISQAPGSQVLGESNSVTQEVVLEIRNGSGKNGAAKTVKNALADLNSVTTITTANAFRDYEKNLIVVLKDVPQELILELQKRYPADVVTLLPEGEKASQSSLLLILGKE